MTIIQNTHALDPEAGYEVTNPFFEAGLTADDGAVRTVGFESPSQSVSPFAEALDVAVAESEADRLMAEAFAELRDETFDEAVAYLTEETEQAVSDRFTNESPASATERERFGDAHLSPIRFEAHQYLEALEAGVSGMDLESLSDEQLDEVLDRFDPQPVSVTPAGEEFIGSLVRKAKKAVKFVVNTAKNVAGKVGGVVLGPVLQKLKGLINPLLRRVLSFAIGRLPAPLQPAARVLAARIKLEAEESEGLDESPMSPANLTDVESLAEDFDAALAEAVMGEEAAAEGASFESLDGEADNSGRELELLAEARGALIDRLRGASDDENLGPAIEQFVPALLGALRLGISLVGRPKVVGFLARYLGQLIRRWVGPNQSGPLSSAIADTGLRLVSLESESGETGESRADEAGPVALASVIEDTVRRLSETEEYVLENEDLTQLAVSEAFSGAVATHFPNRFVRPGLQQAPSIGGTFVARRPRSVRTYRKYSRIPEVEVTDQIADALPTFGGSTVGAGLRAAGVTFPFRARMHIYQSVAGTTLPRMIRMDRPGAGGGRGPVALNVHPLTAAAAGLLLREPRLGVDVPGTFLRSKHRIAIGQRFYVLEPIGGAALGAARLTTRAASNRVAPTHGWTVVNLRSSRITVGFYLSEAEAQAIVVAIRQGRGSPALLQALTGTFRGMHRGGRVRVVREAAESSEDFATPPGGLMAPSVSGPLWRRIGGWVLPALADWTRANGEAFARAAAHPDPGVTIRLRLTGVAGLGNLPQAANAVRAGAGPVAGVGALRGTPSVSITMSPGRPRR